MTGENLSHEEYRKRVFQRSELHAIRFLTEEDKEVGGNFILRCTDFGRETFYTPGIYYAEGRILEEFDKMGLKYRSVPVAGLNTEEISAYLCTPPGEKSKAEDHNI